ncbi:hypothetical protein J2Z42_001630 [Clostridium algifaecis]|uniref:Uncharacterized protein n=1 Tax=Clostridium algifaecis TaxID=1472040 RepID=A0ABS4KU31_9CLOT|nr:hypothetical protein [Clostridium algifaecis]MBP2032951.1 hypothetical protein [Clostridium algifaecis]
MSTSKNIDIEKLSRYFAYFKEKDIGISIEGTNNNLLFYNKSIIYINNDEIVIYSKEDIEKLNMFTIKISNIKSWSRDMCGGLQDILIISEEGCYIQVYNKEK